MNDSDWTVYPSLHSIVEKSDPFYEVKDWALKMVTPDFEGSLGVRLYA